MLECKIDWMANLLSSQALNTKTWGGPDFLGPQFHVPVMSSQQVVAAAVVNFCFLITLVSL